MSLTVSVAGRRALRLVLLCGVMMALGSASAHAQCGQTLNFGPRRAPPPGGAPLALGDSVLYDAGDTLASLGFQVNGMACRTMTQGIAGFRLEPQIYPISSYSRSGPTGS